MNNQFFEKPILNSPYGYPIRHWELNEAGQPTQRIIETRRRAEFITPIPRPKKRKGAALQGLLLFDDGKGLSTAEQRYDHTAIINSVRQQVDQWRRGRHERTQETVASMAVPMALLGDIRHLIDSARQRAASAVNSEEILPTLSAELTPVCGKFFQCP